MVAFTLSNAGNQTEVGADNVDDSVTGLAERFNANKSLSGGGGTGTDSVFLTGITQLANFNLPAVFTGWEILNGRDGVDDIFQASGARVAQFTNINGGTGSDELRLTGGGNISLNGKTLNSLESITTDTTNTNLTVTNQAMGLLVSNMGGAADILTINAWTGGSFVVASLVSLLNGGRGIEEVQWSTPVNNFAAVLNGGTGFIDVTRTDIGGRNYTTRVDSFETDGDLRQQVTNFDDGAISTTNYDANGVITDLTIDATGAARSFQTITDTYSAGKLAQSVLELNDGTTTTKTYDTSGPMSVLQTSVREDLAGGTEYVWDTITETYTAGVLTQRLTVNDDTSSTEMNYSGGVLTSRLITRADTSTSETTFSGGAVVLTRNTAASGEQTVIGGAGDDTIFGGDFNDLLLGGAGNDVFAFSGAFGDDRVSGFVAGDQLDLTAYNIDALADIAGNGFTATQVGRNTVIDLGVNGSVTLLSFDINALDDSDFYAILNA